MLRKKPINLLCMGFALLAVRAFTNTSFLTVSAKSHYEKYNFQMTPYPYQSEALDAMDRHISSKPTVNPCIVLPTGAGKSPVMAWYLQKCMEEYPPFRAICLAHVQELVAQNANKLQVIFPQCPIGVYSASLKSRDMNYPITFASVQSVYGKACSFQPFDLIFIDEAHRIPFKGEGMYRQFINMARMCNPKVVVAGVTATAFRMDGGAICGPRNILNEVVYEANVRDLIEQGYLCGLTTKAGRESIQTDGVHVRQGEFVTAEVAERAIRGDKVTKAVAEAVRLFADRKSIIFFCVNVDHAGRVSGELAKHGIDAPVIEGNTCKKERARIVDSFVAGSLRAVCNVNVLTEGFDAQRIDCVVMLRPTASAGLFYQMVGRGLRKHPSKQNTLVIDLAGNTLRHGPIDLLKPGNGLMGDGSGEPPIKVCPACLEVVPAAAMVCACCGFEFPARAIKHDTKASKAPILSSEIVPWDVDVTEVEYAKHTKEGRPPILKISYYGKTVGEEAGNLSSENEYREWIALEGEGYSRAKAVRWWSRRFGEPVPSTVDEALLSGALGQLKEMTTRIRVRKTGKYTDVLGVTLVNDGRQAMAG